MKAIFDFLKELNGYKYVITIAIAVVGSWYDIKGEISELKSSAAAIKETATDRFESQRRRDEVQERTIEKLHDEVLFEIRLMRQDIQKKK